MEKFDMNMYNMLFPQSESDKTLEQKINIIEDINNDNSKNNTVANGLRQPATAFPEKTPIGMAYVPYQMWEKPYDDAVALARGTIFPSLDKPFIGEEAVNNARKR